MHRSSHNNLHEIVVAHAHTAGRHHGVARCRAILEDLRQGGLVVTNHSEVNHLEAVGSELRKQGGAICVVDLPGRKCSRCRCQLIAGGNHADPGRRVNKDQS